VRKLIGGLSLILMAVAFQPTMATQVNAQTIIVVQNPWLGPGSPWYWWNNAWWYNGVQYGFYGAAYGWRPYGSITNVVVEQPAHYYNNPQWDRWNHSHPDHVQHFHQQYHGGIRNPNYKPTAVPGQRANPYQGQHGQPQFHQAQHPGQPQMHSGQPQMHEQPQMHSGQPQMHERPQMHSGQPQVHEQPQMHSGQPQMHERPQMHPGQQAHVQQAHHSSKPAQKSDPAQNSTKKK
jgi:hypothetical protein